MQGCFSSMFFKNIIFIIIIFIIIFIIIINININIIIVELFVQENNVCK